jgi:hypothetical protein
MATTFKLPPSLSVFLAILVSVPTMTPAMVKKHVGGDGKATVYRLRRNLKGWGIKINSRRHVGYWIDDKDRARIKAYIEASTPEVS